MQTLHIFYIVLGVVSATLHPHSGPRPELGYSVARDSDDDDLLSQLARLLSPGASIIRQDDPRMHTTYQRWQAYSMPTYSAVVEVAVEDDVQKTVCFANNHSLPFLAVDGSHGFISTLGRMQGGLAISFMKMKQIKISPSGDYAELGPGLTNGELIRDLWSKGKQTVTGNCLCTGITGIMLGGGHGYLQGLFGLLADQILEARVVLADGRLVVASQKSNPDLFWALRGAGHNFGIVTGLKYRIYNRVPAWSQYTLVFTQDKLEQVFELANNFLEDDGQPAQLINWFTIMSRHDIDPRSAVINMRMIYAGGQAPLAQHAAPFLALGPASVEIVTVPYPELFNINRNNESSLVTCGKGLYRHLFPTYLRRHNTTALRRVHRIFDDVTAKYPSVAFTSVYVIEGYSQQAVTSVPSDSTAVPFREYSLLSSPVWGYTNPAYSNDIIAASKAMRQAMVEGSGSTKLRAYVNYAFGDESLPEMYGYEPWRLQRLKELKKRYDPRGRFNFYAPIGDSGKQGK